MKVLYIEPLTYLWRNVKKKNKTAFNDNFNQKGATIYLSKLNISRNIRDIEMDLWETFGLNSN